MVESSSSKINFLKLSSQDLSAKIALLVSKTARVVFWKRSPRYFEGKATSYEVNSTLGITLTLERIGIPIRIIGEAICINFSLNDIDYYLRGKVIEQFDDDPKIKILLDEKCFRVEKRSRERLLTYPQYNVYAYLKFSKIIKNENVISFKREESKSKDFYLKLESFNKNKLALIAKEFEHLENEEEIMGFRVEDLSSTGLCFFCNLKERELVIDQIGNQLFLIVLKFDSEIFTLIDSEVVYKMDYINSQFAGVPMHKVGIRFKANPALKRRIEEVSGLEMELLDYQKEFEEFIKNE